MAKDDSNSIKWIFVHDNDVDNEGQSVQVLDDDRTKDNGHVQA